MNGNQKGILIMGITVIAIMSICPPWVFRTVLRGAVFEKDLGYKWIWAPPEHKWVTAEYVDRTEYASAKGVIDMLRLGVQWGGVVIVSIGLIVVFGAKIKVETKNIKLKPSPTGLESSKEPPLPATLQN